MDCRSMHNTENLVIISIRIKNTVINNRHIPPTAQLWFLFLQITCLKDGEIITRIVAGLFWVFLSRKKVTTIHKLVWVRLYTFIRTLYPYISGIITGLKLMKVSPFCKEHVSWYFEDTTIIYFMPFVARMLLGCV